VRHFFGQTVDVFLLIAAAVIAAAAAGAVLGWLYERNRKR
jgi:hypothetical protein